MNIESEINTVAGDAESSVNTSDNDAESLDLVRKILLGDQMRKAERQQASTERYVRDAVAGLNKEMQQQISALRKNLQALEQKTDDWRHDMLTHIKQADQQVQQNKIDRQGMADLLRSMAQLTEQEAKPENNTTNDTPSYKSKSFLPNDAK